MKTITVKCQEVVDELDPLGKVIGHKKQFVSEGPLVIAESLEDLIQMTESGECPESEMVTLFNASRKIRFQAQLKAGNTEKVTTKSQLAQLVAVAQATKNEDLIEKMRSLGIKV